MLNRKLLEGSDTHVTLADLFYTNVFLMKWCKLSVHSGRVVFYRFSIDSKTSFSQYISAHIDDLPKYCFYKYNNYSSDQVHTIVFEFILYMLAFIPL